MVQLLVPPQLLTSISTFAKIGEVCACALQLIRHGVPNPGRCHGQVRSTSMLLTLLLYNSLSLTSVVNFSGTGYSKLGEPMFTLEPPSNSPNR